MNYKIMENIFKIIKNDLSIIDLETTGMDIKNDRIIQIGILKFNLKDNKIEKYKRNIKVDKDISEEAYLIHNISNEDLKNEKYFSEIAEEILDFVKDSDLGGYNQISFDLPFLFEEFSRIGIKFDYFKRKIVDIYKILNKYKPRTLEGVYERMFNSSFKSHDSIEDCYATAKIFNKQIEMWNIDNIEDLHDIIRKEKNIEYIDLSGWFKYDKIEKCYFFHKGKHRNKKVDCDLNYLKWLFEYSDIPNNSKHVANLLWRRYSEKI